MRRIGKLGLVQVKKSPSRIFTELQTVLDCHIGRFHGEGVRTQSAASIRELRTHNGVTVVSSLEGYDAFGKRVVAQEMFIGDGVDVGVRIPRYRAAADKVTNWFIGQAKMNPLMEVGWED